jgi:hypothetical protein
LDDNLLDVGADSYFSAVAFDQRRDAFSDASRASDGIAGAVEIVAGDEGVNSETALRGRQAVVAPLGGEDRDELLISSEAVQNIEGGLRSPAKERSAHETACQPCGNPGNGLFGEVESAGFLSGLHGSQITVDGGGFGREIVLQASAKPLQAGGKFKRPAAHQDAVVNVGHRRPFKLPVGEVVEGGAQRRGGILQSPT